MLCDEHTLCIFSHVHDILGKGTAPHPRLLKPESSSSVANILPKSQFSI